MNVRKTADFRYVANIETGTFIMKIRLMETANDA